MGKRTNALDNIKKNNIWHLIIFHLGSFLSGKISRNNIKRKCFGGDESAV